MIKDLTRIDHDDPKIASIERSSRLWWSSPESHLSSTSPLGHGLALLLVPLRREHRPVDYLNRSKCCSTCFGAHGRPAVWPCSTAELIYYEQQLDAHGRWALDPQRPHTPTRTS